MLDGPGSELAAARDQLEGHQVGLGQVVPGRAGHRVDRFLHVVGQVAEDVADHPAQ
jgi:hypothetical protein